MGVNANQESTVNGQTKDLQMYWKISEYFETLQLLAKRPDARPLVTKLCKELSEFVESNPVILSRQLPILLNYVQILLNMNTQQANKIDAYSALVYSISMVSSNSRCIFENTEAFETFLELFLNGISAKKSSRQWESVMDRLTNLMNAYLCWNPTQAMKFVTRNKSVLFSLNCQFRGLRILRDFIEEFPQVFRYRR